MSAPLVERLRQEWERLSGRSIDRGCVDSGIAANLAEEAASTIEAQAAEIERLNERLENNHVFNLAGDRIDVPPANGAPPMPNDVPIIASEDLKVEVLRRRPPGGQQVGTDTGIRMTHLPSGLTAECDTHRSQHRNRNIALDMILGGLTSPHMR